MSLIDSLRNLERIEERELHEIEQILERHRRRHGPRAVKGRFAGLYWTDPHTGEWTVASQQVPFNAPITAPLVFVDKNGLAEPGPVGTIAVTDPAGTAALSADGQHANITVTVAATATWTDPSGVVPSFSVDLTEAIGPVVSGSFGTFVPGTTA